LSASLIFEKNDLVMFSGHDAFEKKGIIVSIFSPWTLIDVLFYEIV